MTYCTGNLTSIRLRSEAMCTCSRWCSSEGPSYQGMLAERSTTLSPCSAEIGIDRKSTRLNSSHMSISYAVFCLKKKKYKQDSAPPAFARASCRHGSYMSYPPFHSKFAAIVRNGAAESPLYLQVRATGAVPVGNV